jgi:hypothetical protein
MTDAQVLDRSADGREMANLFQGPVRWIRLLEFSLLDTLTGPEIILSRQVVVEVIDVGVGIAEFLIRRQDL